MPDRRCEFCDDPAVYEFKELPYCRGCLEELLEEAERGIEQSREDVKKLKGMLNA